MPNVPPTRILIHATTVALVGPSVTIAALLRGPSGAGKSDLALRFVLGRDNLCEPAMQRALVADDQTWVELENGRLTATSPATIAGCIEVRGVGIVPITSVPSAEARLMVDLVGVGQVERLPAADTTETLLGQRLPLRRLVALEASAPLKLAIMMMSLTQ